MNMKLALLKQVQLLENYSSKELKATDTGLGEITLASNEMSNTEH